MKSYYNSKLNGFPNRTFGECYAWSYWVHAPRSCSWICCCDGASNHIRWDSRIRIYILYLTVSCYDGANTLILKSFYFNTHAIFYESKLRALRAYYPSSIHYQTSK
jgi:hypothetical protein